MYGLLNKAIQGLIESEYGREAWGKTLEEAGLEPEPYVALQSYPDETTYALVEAASRVVEVPGDRLLHALGRYWIEAVATTSYADWFEQCTSLRDSLDSLDDMHARLSLGMPELRPPSFELQVQQDGELRLHYFSHRTGLIPLVRGLVEGLAAHYGEVAEVLARPRERGHVEFQIRSRSAGGALSDVA